MTHLKTYLRNAKIRQGKFAEQLGISKSYMSEIASGKRAPSLKVASDIEAATRGKVKARLLAIIIPADPKSEGMQA